MKIAAIVYILGGLAVAAYGVMRFAGLNTTRLVVLIAAGLYLVSRGVSMMKRR
ncbi:MAG: hypothetical protein U0Q16_02145 [Bryobacteraceae bacterium]